MPVSSSKPCRHSGCDKLVTSTKYCEAHKDEAQAWHRYGKKHDYYGSAWRKLRAIVLKRDMVCKVCGVRASTDCDHVIPVSRGGKDELENLQGLCRGCHAEKTKQESTAARKQ